MWASWDLAHEKPIQLRWIAGIVLRHNGKASGPETRRSGLVMTFCISEITVNRLPRETSWQSKENVAVICIVCPGSLNDRSQNTEVDFSYIWEIIPITAITWNQQNRAATISFFQERINLIRSWFFDDIMIKVSLIYGINYDAKNVKNDAQKTQWRNNWAGLIRQSFFRLRKNNY